MKKLIWTLAFALLCLSSCRDYRYRIEDSIYVPEVRDISILDIQENCATLSFEVRETSELGVGQCGILFSLSDFDNPKETGSNIIDIDCGRGARNSRIQTAESFSFQNVLDLCIRQK